MRYIFLLTVASTVVFPSIAFASCPCPPKSVGEKYEASQSVFLGKLLKAVEIPSQPRMERLTFALEQSWKGTGLQTQDVLIPVSVDTCGLTEERIGLSYLVYARATASGELITSVCDGTDLSDALTPEMTTLTQIYHPRSTVTPVFPDVPSDHPFTSAIADFAKHRIISGFPDGTLRPEWSLTRAEAVKIITLATQEYLRTYDDDAYDHRSISFRDTDERAWYYPSLLRSITRGFIKGFPDGTFRPEKSVTVAEASSMIVKAFGIESLTREDAEWYVQYIHTLAGLHALPTSIRSVHEPIKRGELIEVLWRVANHIQSRTSLQAESLMQSSCVPSNESTIAHVDMRRVRAEWLSLYNGVRKAHGLPLYRLDENLNDSSTLWSTISARKGVMEHKRSANQLYYDYSAIQKWFSDLGLVFQNVHSMTFTESIGNGPYACSLDDCTNALVSAIRSTFDFYMTEETKEYRPHYSAIVNPYFTIMGMGVATKNGQYYITTHFATKIVSTPLARCRDLSH